jgi:hypothetical protein
MALLSNLKEAQLQEQHRQARIRRGELRLKPDAGEKADLEQAKDPSESAPTNDTPTQQQ